MQTTVVSDALMEAFVIEGARPLNGAIRAAGNKNAALPIIAATLLTDEPVTLTNVPAITDVQTMLELVADLGVDVEQGTRGEVIVPPPGGDVIGRRRLDTHIHAFARLGAQVHANRRYHMRAEQLVGADVFLDEASVTGTENAVMAAVLARGGTKIEDAASEPHVQDLCRFLVSLGADIDGIGSNVLHIPGVDRLPGGSWRVCPDHIEVASFMGLAAVTEGDILIE